MRTNGLDYTILTIVIIGAINWGLIGFFGFDLINVVFGNITLLEIYVFIPSLSNVIGSLPSKSSTSTSFILLIVASPLIISYIPGIICNLHVVFLHILIISVFSSVSNVGIAIIITSISYSLTKSGISYLFPTTLTPEIL